MIWILKMQNQYSCFFLYFKPDIPKKPPPNTTPAMNVNTSAGGMGVFDKDYISYTVSAPSGRGTAMLSVDGKWHPLPTFLILIFFWDHSKVTIW